MSFSDQRLYNTFASGYPLPIPTEYLPPAHYGSYGSPQPAPYAAPQYGQPSPYSIPQQPTQQGRSASGIPQDWLNSGPSGSNVQRSAPDRSLITPEDLKRFQQEDVPKLRGLGMQGEMDERVDARMMMGEEKYQKYINSDIYQKYAKTMQSLGYSDDAIRRATNKVVSYGPSSNPGYEEYSKGLDTLQGAAPQDRAKALESFSQSQLRAPIPGEAIYDNYKSYHEQ